MIEVMCFFFIEQQDDIIESVQESFLDNTQRKLKTLEIEAK